jgi:hypothetical protein
VRRLKACVCIALCSSRWAFAQSPSYELDYDADPSCPDAATFSRLVETQLEQFESPVTSLAGLRARVTLRTLPEGAWARFELVRPDGASYERELHERSCEEVAPALAFVLAYALGGQERSGPPPPASSREVATQTAKAASTPALPVRQPEPRGSPATDSVPPPSAQREPPWQVGFGVELGARTGLGPIWTPVEGAVLELRRSGSTFPRLHLRASVLHGEPVTRIDAAGETQFSWLAGRFDVCPLELTLMTTLSLLPCLGSHVGRFEAVGRPNGQTAASGRTAKKPWFDAVISLRMELLLWRVLALQARGELLLPLIPYQFVFDNPVTAVYQVPRVASAAFIGVGGRFP